MTDTLMRGSLVPSRRGVLGGAAALTALAAGFVAAPRTALARQARDMAMVDGLIAQMTIQEKAGQLSLFGDPFRFRPENVNPLDGEGNPAKITALIRAGHLGNLFNGVGAEAGRTIQRIAVEETRLKIPMMFAADIIHGFSTIFPIPMGEAASFEPELARRTARVAAIEGAASGVHQTYAPMVDIGRDQRWGRVAEGAGEDVYLGMLMAAARVRGFQGENGLDAPDSLLATPKHFAAYGAAEGGMEYNTTDMSDARLRQTYLPPFKAAFDAGALSTMSAFNDLNGVPASGSHYLMTEILRDEWGFTGYVVSDYTSEQELIAHGFAEDGRDAARIALLAGVDMSMVSGLYFEHIPDLVAKGDVPMEVIDRSVRRVLMTKAALGLFEDPYRGMDPRVERRVIGTDAHYALSRESGRKSCVLLKNEGGLLPLKKTGQKIALIGPFADDTANILGNWVIWGNKTRLVSLEAGFRNAMGPDAALTVVKGSEIDAVLPGGIEAAVLAASAADVVVLAIGEAENMTGEAQSRVDIVVPAAQMALAEAVAATGRPVVVLLRNGRALALKGAVKDAGAILVTWFLGNEMGNSVADIVFGDHGPGGRLPVSFPHESGQQPFYYDHKTTGRPASPTENEFKARYRETNNTALYPFGHGLTYGQVTYGEVALSAATMAWDGEVEASVVVTNGGTRAAEEVVQLYTRDPVASLTQPIRSLKGFQKVALKAGEAKTIRFTLNRAMLAFVGPDDQPLTEPGAFDVWLAPSAQAGEPMRFILARG